MAPKPSNNRDFLIHLETYLAKRDGVDKLLKVSRYATKLILASHFLPQTLTLIPNLKSFESSVGVSRKAFRLGKFIQNVNSLRNASFQSNCELILYLLAHLGEGFYYFVEQFVWLAKAGLIDKRHMVNLQLVSAWAEFVGYFGSVSLKIRELRRIGEEEACLVSTIEVEEMRGEKCGEEGKERLRALRGKKMMKRLAVVQDLADGLMALDDIRDGKGRFTGPVVLASAGLLSALISTHKNWVSC